MWLQYCLPPLLFLTLPFSWLYTLILLYSTVLQVRRGLLYQRHIPSVSITTLCQIKHNCLSRKMSWPMKQIESWRQAVFLRVTSPAWLSSAQFHNSKTLAVRQMLWSYNKTSQGEREAYIPIVLARGYKYVGFFFLIWGWFPKKKKPTPDSKRVSQNCRSANMDGVLVFPFRPSLLVPWELLGLKSA